MTQEQIALSQTEQILTMIGPHGVFAIVGAIIVVRAIRALWYLDKRQSFIVNIIVSALIGAAAVYFYAEISDLKAVAGGAFMTPIGAMIVYELAKWVLAFLYEKTQSKTIKALFFFLSPKPIKYKKDGMKFEEPPHSELTQLFDVTRLDK